MTPRPGRHHGTYKPSRQMDVFRRENAGSDDFLGFYDDAIAGRSHRHAHIAVGALPPAIALFVNFVRADQGNLRTAGALQDIFLSIERYFFFSLRIGSVESDVAQEGGDAGAAGAGV